MTHLAACYGIFGAGMQALIEEVAGHSGRRWAVDGHVSEYRLASLENSAAEMKMRKAFNVSDAH